MRKPISLLTPLLASLLLTGCVNDSASYQIEGNDHALTLRVVQDYFWSKHATLRLTAARLPDCQRQMALGEVSLSGLEIELFASGPDVYTLRAGEDVWQVDARSCTELEAPAADAVTGEALGSFHLDERDKLVFAPASDQQ
ncbi:hypothetical protein IM543_00105 [Massilia sp. UMI-21]|nr:hypothetical protein IM543_00105 [Massilia sp. UMI-21]